MNTISINNPHNIFRRVGAERITESGRNYQILEPREGTGEPYALAINYDRKGETIISATIFRTKDQALEDCGAY